MYKRRTKISKETEPLLGNTDETTNIPEDRDSSRGFRVVICICVCLCVVAGVIIGIYFGIENSSDDEILHNHTHTSLATTTGATTTGPAIPGQVATSAGAVTEGTRRSTTQEPAATVATTQVPATEPQQEAVALQLLCNVRFENGTCRAIVTYQNDNDSPITVPHGPNNYVSPGNPNLNQRTLFKIGLNYGGATFLWDCASHDEVVWTLRSGGRGVAMTAIIPAEERECPPVPTGQSALDHTISGVATLQ